jgi:flagellar basal-body rod protein FlgG
MMRALFSAASGTLAQQFNIDVIANNVANVNTTGFKKVRAEFQDLLSQTFKAAGATLSSGTIDPTTIQVGLGTKVSATQRVFLPGSVVQTGNTYDLAIMGDGFFQVQLPSGENAYTRDGTFKVDANGLMVTSDGYPMNPNITIPNDAVQVSISTDGTVSVQQAGQSTLSQVGNIQLARFSNPAGMESVGRNLFRETPASGTPIQGQPGQGPLAGTTIEQGALEGSNIQIVEELVNLITAQRAFEANSKVIRAGDTALAQINQITG